MEHSDELTFADYFNAEKEIYRNITCAALAARWLLDHGFVMPLLRGGCSIMVS